MRLRATSPRWVWPSSEARRPPLEPFDLLVALRAGRAGPPLTLTANPDPDHRHPRHHPHHTLSRTLSRALSLVLHRYPQAAAFETRAQVIMDYETERAIAAFVARGVSVELIGEIDANGDGTVDRLEFLVHMLRSLGKLEQQDIDQVPRTGT